MPAPRLPIALVAAILALAAAPRDAAAAPADCERALALAATVVDDGQRAFAGRTQYESTMWAQEARIPAIDAARAAQACGCRDAIPFLADAAEASARSSATANITAGQQYGATIRKHGEAAIAALRDCAPR